MLKCSSIKTWKKKERKKPNALKMNISQEEGGRAKSSTVGEEFEERERGSEGNQEAKVE